MVMPRHPYADACWLLACFSLLCVLWASVALHGQWMRKWCSHWLHFLWCLGFSVVGNKKPTNSEIISLKKCLEEYKKRAIRQRVNLQGRTILNRIIQEVLLEVMGKYRVDDCISAKAQSERILGSVWIRNKYVFNWAFIMCRTLCRLLGY